MINAIIIDDEPLAISVVEEYLAKHQDIEVIGTFNDGFQGLKGITELKPDLVFLDVQMPKISGIEMLELLDDLPAIVFTTAFEEYAIKAFEANAIDYLLKPFSQDRFDASIERFKLRPANQKTEVSNLLAAQPTNRIVLKDNGRIRILALKDVDYLEADDDYVKIVSANESFLKKTTLKRYEEQLPNSQFIRVHRSFMVNLSKITRIDPYEKTSHMAILKSGTRLPVSKSGYLNLKEVLGI
jgi:two-component system, LytTR family, response regulator